MKGKSIYLLDHMTKSLDVDVDERAIRNILYVSNYLLFARPRPFSVHAINIKA